MYTCTHLLITWVVVVYVITDGRHTKVHMCKYTAQKYLLHSPIQVCILKQGELDILATFLCVLNVFCLVTCCWL